MKITDYKTSGEIISQLADLQHQLKGLNKLLEESEGHNVRVKMLAMHNSTCRASYEVSCLRNKSMLIKMRFLIQEEIKSLIKQLKELGISFE